MLSRDTENKKNVVSGYHGYHLAEIQRVRAKQSKPQGYRDYHELSPVEVGLQMDSIEAYFGVRRPQTEGRKFLKLGNLEVVARDGLGPPTAVKGTQVTVSSSCRSARTPRPANLWHTIGTLLISRGLRVITLDPRFFNSHSVQIAVADICARA